jgi:hypothetical protein
MEQYEKILSLVLQTAFTVLVLTAVTAVIISAYNNFKNK